MGQPKEVLGAAKGPGSLSIDRKGAFDRASRLHDLREDSDKAKVPVGVAKAIGRRLALQALSGAAKKAAAKLARGSREWTKVFPHIAEHFSKKIFGEKVAHGVFVAALRSRAALEPLVEQTLRNPGNKQITKALVHDVAAGKPVVIVERLFEQEIGETFFRRGVGAAERIEVQSCKILRVIVDITGVPLTAYPVSEFFRAVL